jgi:hypothetical protein
MTEHYLETLLPKYYRLTNTPSRRDSLGQAEWERKRKIVRRPVCNLDPPVGNGPGACSARDGRNTCHFWSNRLFPGGRCRNIQSQIIAHSKTVLNLFYISRPLQILFIANVFTKWLRSPIVTHAMLGGGNFTQIALMDKPRYITGLNISQSWI